MLHLALPLLLLNSMEVKSQCLQDLSLLVIHHYGRERHCCSVMDVSVVLEEVLKITPTTMD